MTECKHDMPLGNCCQVPEIDFLKTALNKLLQILPCGYSFKRTNMGLSLMDEKGKCIMNEPHPVTFVGRLMVMFPKWERRNELGIEKERLERRIREIEQELNSEK